MTTHDQLTQRQRQRLADFDAGLATLIETPIHDAPRSASGSQRRIGPTLWPVLQDVLTWSMNGLLQIEPVSGDWLAALTSLPVYAWAVLAGVVLTIGTTLIES